MSKGRREKRVLQGKELRVQRPCGREEKTESEKVEKEHRDERNDMRQKSQDTGGHIMLYLQPNNHRDSLKVFKPGGR